MEVGDGGDDWGYLCWLVTPEYLWRSFVQDLE